MLCRRVSVERGSTVHQRDSDDCSGQVIIYLDTHEYGNANVAANIIPPEHVTLTMITTAVCVLFLNYYFISFFVISLDYKRYLSKKTSAILLELF